MIMLWTRCVMATMCYDHAVVQAFAGICSEPRFIEALETVREMAKLTHDDQFPA